jgi:glycosyltransferase involved in cell wall biosynthesis
MRALVITEFPPLIGGFAARGNYRRFCLFMAAISEIADNVEILHLRCGKSTAANHESGSLDVEQSAHLGLPISTYIVEPRSRRKNFVNEYLSGILSVYEKDEFFPFCGAEQAGKVRELLGRSPDLVFVHRLVAMLPVIRSRCRPMRMFFDLDDIEHRKQIQTALQRRTLVRKLAQLARVPAIASAELRGAGLSRLTFVCSEIDRSRLARLGLRRLAVVPNAVTIPSEPPQLPIAPRMLFLGFCHYSANYEAAERLVRTIFPKIRSLVPEAQLLIAGSGSLELRSRRDRPEGVQYLGYVEDLPALYASSRVVCCPLTHGSGTRLKLIEAAAHARPMVATRLGAEGLDFRDEIEILLREDDDAIAAACARLMRDEAFSRALGAEARARVRQKYDAEVIRRAIVRMLLDSDGGPEDEKGAHAIRAKA